MTHGCRICSVIALTAVNMCSLADVPEVSANDDPIPPTEFVQQVLEPTGGKVLRPKDWFCAEGHRGPVFTWTLSREDASKRPYTTGVRIQVFTKVKAGTGKSPKEFILEFVAAKKKSAAKVIKDCAETDQGMFTRVCLQTEEGPDRILYSLFWGNNLDIACVSIAGTAKELWKTYTATFDKMSAIEIIDMSRFVKSKEQAEPTRGAYPGSIRSKADFEAFTQRYYLESHPELVSEAIAFITANRMFDNPTAIPPVMAFFTQVFARNRDRVPGWTEVINRQPQQVRSSFNRAIALSTDPKQLMAGESASPRLNDIYWGAFFGSGDPLYLNHLLAQLAYLNERKDLNLYATAASAKWSLASNAARHPVVKAAVEAARANAAEPLRKELDEILTKPVAEIRRDMLAVIREQRQSSPFEANAIWVKGTPDLEQLKKLDPEKRTKEFSLKNDEDVTLYVSYRSPARDEKKWAKVSYRLAIEKPNGELSNAKDNLKDILAGEGVAPDERLRQWAASHGRITVRFSEKDPRGVYIFRATIKDHVGDQQIVRLTKVHLE